MLTKRIIVCLDVDAGRVVKGTRFVDVRDVGDPVALAERYEREGADEIVFLDITASSDGRKTMLDVARRAADRLFIPLTIGGGIRSVSDIARTLHAGADKVGINSAAVGHPELLTEAAALFGSQCVVASIDAKRHKDGWEVYVHGGRRPTGLNAVDWARACADGGAGEILLTSIDRDGARTGYDLGLVRAVANAVDIPVIASGGAGTAAHVRAAIDDAGADAALVAGILHDGSTTIRDIKRAMTDAGVPIRWVA
jgi:imidazole glycerol-phosphate synthase subunit HisF